MKIDVLAEELNNDIKENNTSIYNMLSAYGRSLYFPKGIVTQSAEAKAQAYRLNATVGIARVDSKPMCIDAVRDLISAEIGSDEIFPYAPAAGIFELRKLWQEKLYKSCSKLVNMSLPIVTSGITHGLSLVGDLFIDKKTPVVLPDMYWGNYRMMWAHKKNCSFHTYSLFDSELRAFNLSGFKNTLIEVGKKFGKVVVVLNFPHNPTGYTPLKSESIAIKKTLAEVADSGINVIVVCDDAYSGFVYEDECDQSSFIEDLSEVSDNLLCVKVDGCTKEYFVWGFRVGFLTFAAKSLSKKACNAIEVKASGSIRATLSNSSHLCQSLMLKTLKNPQHRKQVRDNFLILQDRYQEVKVNANRSEFNSLWSVYPCNSGYFITVRLKSSVSADEIRRKLLKDFGIGVVSIGSNNIRIAFSCFAKKDTAEVFSSLAKCIASFN
jgi:aspartate/methionine/tyrosine aminotransferase